MTTYTPNLKLGQPASGDRTWNVPVNGNTHGPRCAGPRRRARRRHDRGAVGNAQRSCCGRELPQAGWHDRHVCRAASQPMTSSATNYLYLDLTSSGTLTVNTTGFPTTAHVRLATVVAAARRSRASPTHGSRSTSSGSFADGDESHLRHQHRDPDRHGRQPEARLLRQYAGRSADPAAGHRRHELYEQ